MPGMRAVSRRRSASTFCSAGRSVARLELDEQAAVVEARAASVAPTIEATLATCGERRNASATCCCSSTMASNEMSCRASVETESWPMSSCGKKPLGVANTSQAVPSKRGEEDHEHHRLVPQAVLAGCGRSRAARHRSRARTATLQRACCLVLLRLAQDLGGQHRRQRQRHERRGGRSPRSPRRRTR